MGTNARKRRMLIKQVILLCAIVIGAWFGYDAVARAIEERNLLAVHFELPNGAKTKEYRLQVAKNESQRRQGLMYVKEDELAGGRGMIFIFAAEKPQSFWMKNTPSPLDMVFVNQKQEVVGVVDSAKPFSTEFRSVPDPSIYVVELLGGTASQDGITKGAKLRTAAALPPAE